MQSDLVRWTFRRIGKIFALLGESMENVYFMGYSRGAGVALQTLSMTKKDGFGKRCGVCSAPV